jgi:hypothetical protein
MTPIRKGSNPVKIPFAINSSDRTFAAWCNEVRTALQQLEARVPTANIGRGSSSSVRQNFWTTISKTPNSSAENPVFQATPSLGYLIYQQATMAEQEDESVGWIAPKIMVNGQLVSIEPPSANDAPTNPPWSPPSVELPAVQSWVYLRVKTDADGAPKLDGESVTIEAFDEQQVDIHHVRPSPSGGEEEGDYFFLILETEGDGGDPERPIIRRRITGNRQLPNQLIEITNIGGKRELYQGYLPGPDDKHEFRTLEQLEGDGEPIIKGLDAGDPGADPPVPAEEEGPTIKWRRIAERATSPQIQVKDGGNVIRIEGNGNNLSYIDPFEGQINFTDGLVTDIQGGTFNGWWGTDSIQFDPGTGSIQTLIREFRNGILVSVTNSQGIAGAGTEADPGFSVFQMGDT